MMTLDEIEIKKERLVGKHWFAGISLGGNPATESGIAVIDSDLNIVRIDKAFNLGDIEAYIKNLAPANSIVLCVDLPRNTNIMTNKWRYEARNTKALRLNGLDCSNLSWTERISDRGSELCNMFISTGIVVYRYNSYYTRNILNLNAPFKFRTPVACKHLQMSIKNNLKISGIPSNLIAVSGLEALVGAYTSWKIVNSDENIGYKSIGNYKNFSIISAI